MAFKNRAPTENKFIFLRPEKEFIFLALGNPKTGFSSATKKIFFFFALENPEITPPEKDFLFFHARESENYAPEKDFRAREFRN